MFASYILENMSTNLHKKYKQFRPTFRHLIPAAIEIYLTPLKLKIHKSHKIKHTRLGKLVEYVLELFGKIIATLIIISIFYAFVHGLESLLTFTLKGLIVGLVICLPIVILICVLNHYSKNYE